MNSIQPVISGAPLHQPRHTKLMSEPPSDSLVQQKSRDLPLLPEHDLYGFPRGSNNDTSPIRRKKLLSTANGQQQELVAINSNQMMHPKTRASGLEPNNIFSQKQALVNLAEGYDAEAQTTEKAKNGHKRTGLSRPAMLFSSSNIPAMEGPASRTAQNWNNSKGTQRVGFLLDQQSKLSQMQSFGENGKNSS